MLVQLRFSVGELSLLFSLDCVGVDFGAPAIAMA
jgi:hypothetical protein